MSLPMQLDIDKLKELAIEDIKNKLSSKNILPELFSEFSSLCVTQFRLTRVRI